MSVVAHFFMSVGGSEIHERLAHFFIDFYTYSEGNLFYACGFRLILITRTASTFNIFPLLIRSMSPQSRFRSIVRSCSNSNIEVVGLGTSSSKIWVGRLL